MCVCVCVCVCCAVIDQIGKRAAVHAHIFQSARFHVHTHPTPSDVIRILSSLHGLDVQHIQSCFVSSSFHLLTHRPQVALLTTYQATVKVSR